METQTITIGKKRYVLMPEKEYEKLRTRKDRQLVCEDIVSDAMTQVQEYRKTGQARDWAEIKKELGL